MSWGYWGIVGVLVILVGLTLACIMFLASSKPRHLPPQEETAEDARTTMGPADRGHRQAA